MNEEQSGLQLNKEFLLVSLIWSSIEHQYEYSSSSDSQTSLNRHSVETFTMCQNKYQT